MRDMQTEKIIKHLAKFIDPPRLNQIRVGIARVENDLKPWLYIKTDPIVRYLDKLFRSTTLDLVY